LQNLQQRLLDQSVDDTRHGHIKLHFAPVSLWVRLR
jgi:hypothetical protein